MTGLVPSGAPHGVWHRAGTQCESAGMKAGPGDDGWGGGSGAPPVHPPQGMGGGSVGPLVKMVGGGRQQYRPLRGAVSLCPEPGAFLASQLYHVPGPMNLGLCPAQPKGRVHDAV